MDTRTGARTRLEWTMDKKKKRRKRRAFTPEFKAEAVRLCRVGDRSVAQVADDLDLTETALSSWVNPLIPPPAMGHPTSEISLGANSLLGSDATASGSRWNGASQKHRPRFSRRRANAVGLHRNDGRGLPGSARCAACSVWPRSGFSWQPSSVPPQNDKSALSVGKARSSIA